jgi:hypothetical protein
MTKFVGGLVIVDAKEIDGYCIVDMAEVACEAGGMLIVRNSDAMDGYCIVDAMKKGGKHIMLIPEGTDFSFSALGSL